MENFKNVLLNMDFSGLTKVDFEPFIRDIVLKDKDCLVKGIYYIPGPIVQSGKGLTMEQYQQKLFTQFNNLPICYNSDDIDFPVKVKINWGIDVWGLNKKYNLNLNEVYNGMVIVIGPLDYDNNDLVEHFNYIKSLPF